MIHLCVPVLNRYDLLRDLLASLQTSTVAVDVLCLVDNGRQPDQMTHALSGHDHLRGCRLDVYTPPEQAMGLAEAWNYMIGHTTDDRLIVNDDIEFAPHTIELMLATPGDLVSASGVSMCSCFVLRDSCVAKVGLFDERISPGYAYFEDNDYAERMFDAGAIRGDVECGVIHKQSQTAAAYTHEERVEHSRKFCIAEQNFIKKWGFHPRDHRPGRDVWEPMPITPGGPVGGGGRRIS